MSKSKAQQRFLQEIDRVIHLYSSGKLTEALAAVEQLLEANPGAAVLHNIRGTVLAGLKQLESAVESFRRTVALAPQFAEAYRNLGNALFEMKQLEPAAESYTQAVALMPDQPETYLCLGNTHRRLGDLEPARENYQHALRCDAHCAEAHCGLAKIYRLQGDNESALASNKKALKIRPDYAEALNNMGNALRSLGRLEEAITSFERALLIDPAYREAHNNLGVALKDSGDLEGAIGCYEKTLAIDPGFALAHNNLGGALREKGQLDAAVACFKRALELNPDYAEAYHNLGNAQRELGNWAESAENHRSALQVRPDYAGAHSGLGNALKELGDLDGAMACFQRALDIDSGFAGAHNNMGTILKDRGDIAAAEDSYQRALRLAPENAEAHKNLSSTKSYQPGDAQIADMEGLLSNPQTPEPDKKLLNFALSKVYQDLENYELSIKFLNEGNRLRKNELEYKISDDIYLVQKIKEIFSTMWPYREAVQSAPLLRIQPIFIVGMPRSGTTLVEQVLASHSLVHGAGELDAMTELVTPIVTEASKRTRVPESGWISREEILALRESYMNALAALEVTESIVTDKMPLNFLWIGLILRAFPDAKIVNLNRDPRATCWSIYQKHFTVRGNGYAYDLEDLVTFYKLYCELMDFWREQFPGKIYDLCYEDLTLNQEEETRALLAYCELEWEKQCLDFHKTERIVKTASASQVREKMYRGSSDAWKKYEPFLQPPLAALNDD